MFCASRIRGGADPRLRRVLSFERRSSSAGRATALKGRPWVRVPPPLIALGSERARRTAVLPGWLNRVARRWARVLLRVGSLRSSARTTRRRRRAGPSPTRSLRPRSEVTHHGPSRPGASSAIASSAWCEPIGVRGLLAASRRRRSAARDPRARPTREHGGRAPRATCSASARARSPRRPPRAP